MSNATIIKQVYNFVKCNIGTSTPRVLHGNMELYRVQSLTLCENYNCKAPTSVTRGIHDRNSLLHRTPSKQSSCTAYKHNIHGIKTVQKPIIISSQVLIRHLQPPSHVCTEGYVMLKFRSVSILVIV
jgi:hypothetical protein